MRSVKILMNVVVNVQINTTYCLIVFFRVFFFICDAKCLKHKDIALSGVWPQNFQMLTALVNDCSF